MLIFFLFNIELEENISLFTAGLVENSSKEFENLSLLPTNQ